MSTDTVAERKVDVGNFTELKASGAFKVELRVGEPSVVLRVDEDAIDDVEAVVEGSTLRIRAKAGRTVSVHTLEAIVHAPALSRIAASGATRITLADPIEATSLTLRSSGASSIKGNVTTDSLNLQVSGASSANLTGAAPNMDAEISGASRVDLSGLQSTDVVIKVSGASSASITASGEIRPTVAGVSSLKHSGGGHIVEEHVSGASSIKSV